MRVAIDYTAALEEGAGIGRFTRELVGALLAANTGDDYVLLGPRGAVWPNAVAGAPRTRCATLPLPARAMQLLWHRLHAPVPVDHWTGPVDLYHATDYTLPPHRAPAAVTVHDLSFMRHPEFAVPALARFLNAAVPHAVREAALVLADSEHTRQDVIGLLGAPADKVRVVYGGVSPAFRPQPREEVRRATAAYGLSPGGYILSVGRLEPRKNLVGLLHAYRRLLDRGATEGALLAIGGAEGWLFEPIYRAVRDLKLRDHVRFLGRVNDHDLPALLTGAVCFAYPSYYEGFGLPPLEAAACGTPVVASNASCLPEVLGDAALYAAPDDHAALAANLERVIRDEGLRERLEQRGLVRAQQFTWGAAAQQLSAAYHSVATTPVGAR